MSDSSMNPEAIGQRLAADLTPDELLNSAREHSAWAFEEIVRRYRPGMISAVRGRLKSHPAADEIVEEATQRAFLSLVRRIEKVRQPDRLPAYMAKATRRIAARLQSRWKRLGSLDVEPIDWRTLQSESYRAELEETLFLIQRLGETEREAIQAAIDGLSGEQAAQRLGGTPKNYRVILYRARRQLREMMLNRGSFVGLGLFLSAGSVGRAVSPVLIAAVVLFAFAGLGWTAWSANRSSSGARDGETVQVRSPLKTPSERELRQTRVTKAITEAAPKLEILMAKVAIGNKGYAKIVSVDDNADRPEIILDWACGFEGNNGKPIWEYKAKLSFIYDQKSDETRLSYQRPESTNWQRIRYHEAIIIHESKLLGTIALPLKPVAESELVMRPVREAAIVDRERIDRVLAPVIPQLLDWAKRHAKGNEAEVKFRGINYGTDAMRLMFEWRCRHRKQDGTLWYDVPSQLHFVLLRKAGEDRIYWHPMSGLPETSMYEHIFDFRHGVRVLPPESHGDEGLIPADKCEPLIELLGNVRRELGVQ